jgi:prolyl-tRNA synthetase
MDNIDQKIKGFYVLNPLQTKRMNSICSKLAKKIEQRGFRQYKFPTIGLIEDLQKEKQHLSIGAECFKTEEYSYFLKATSEAVAYPMVYSNNNTRLPFKWYSVGSVFRNESKACKKNLRARQIYYFFEAHSIYSKKQNLEIQLENLKCMIYEFLRQIGIPCRVYIRPPWDTFPGAKTTYAYDTFIDGEPLQVATLHDLDDTFSKAYRSSDKPLFGLCFGVTERLLGALEGHYKEDIRYFQNKTETIAIASDNLNLDYLHKIKTLEDEKIVQTSSFRKNQLQKIQNDYDPIYTVKVGDKEIKGTAQFVYHYVEKKSQIPQCEEKNKILNSKIEVKKVIAKTRKKLFILAKQKMEESIKDKKFSELGQRVI